MKPGTKIKMTQTYKDGLSKNGSQKHVKEFGECIGIVIGLTDYGSQKGPEVDVRWQPSDLRYAYLPEELERVK